MDRRSFINAMAAGAFAAAPRGASAKLVTVATVVPATKPLSTLAPGYARALEPWVGTSYHRSDYSGLALDSAHDRILFFGGGHGPGQETDIRAFDLATLQWSSLYPPTPWADMIAANVTRYGAFSVPGKNPVPCARHTYNGQCVVAGRLYLLANQFEYVEHINGAALPTSFFTDVRIPYFDLASGKWSWSKMKQIGQHFASGACATTDSRAFVISPWSDAWLYDPATDKATQLPFTCGLGTPSVVYFPPNGKYYALYQNGDAYEVTLARDLSKSTATKIAATDFPAVGGYVKYSYDAINHVIGSNLNGGLYVTFNPAAKVWKQETVQVEAGSTGTPGTVFFCSERDPRSGCNISLGADGNTWAYRPKADGVPVPRPAPLPRPVSSSDRVQMGDDAALNDGPNWAYANLVLRKAWKHLGGDWRDASDVAQGKTHYALSPLISAPGDVSLDCTALVKRLLTENTGFYLNATQGGIRFIRPRLRVDSLDLSPTVQCWLEPSSGTLHGVDGMNVPAIVKFDLSAVTAVTKVTLTVQVLAGVGALTANYLDPPSLALTGPVVQGIAATVATDKALAAHPAVLIYDELVSPQYVLNNFQGISSSTHGVSNIEIIDWPQYGLKAARVWSAVDNQKIISWHHWGIPKQKPPRAWQRDYGDGFTHLFCRYLVCIGADLQAGMNENGIKLPGLSGTFDYPAEAPTNPTPKGSAWNATLWHGKLSPANPGRSRLSVYYYGADKPYDGAPDSPTAGILRSEPHIHCVEEEVKLNTIGQADGEIRIWLDGVMVFEKTGMQMRVDDKARIQDMPFMLIYHGGMGLPKARFHYDIGGIVIAKRYVGVPKLI